MHWLYSLKTDYGTSLIGEVYFLFLCDFTSSVILYLYYSYHLQIHYTAQLVLHIANFMTCDIAFVLFKLLPGASVSLYAMFDSDFQGISCKFIIASSFPYVAGFFILVVVAGDSLLKIILPFKYKQIMGIRIASCVSFSWSIGLLFLVPVITGE